MTRSSLSIIWVGLAYLAAFAASFAITRSVLHLSTIEVFAKLSLFLSMGVALRVLWFAILGTVFARAATTAERDGSLSVLLRLLTGMIWGPSVAICGLALVAAWLGAALQIGDIRLDGRDLLAGTFLAVSVPAAGALVEVANAMGRTRTALVAMIYPAAAQLSSIALLSMFDRPDAATFALLAASQSLLCQWLVLSSLRPEDAAPDTKSAGAMKAKLRDHAVRMASWIPATLVSRAADRWVAAAFLSLTDFAAFALILIVTQGAMAAATSALSRVVAPRVYRLSDQSGKDAEARDLLYRAGIVVLCGGGLLVAGCSFLGEEILGFLGGPEFEHYAGALTLAAFGATLQSFALLQVTLGHARGRISPYTPAKYAEAGTYLIGLVLLTPNMGVQGAALALLWAGGIGAILSIWANRQLGRVEWQP